MVEGVVMSGERFKVCMIDNLFIIDVKNMWNFYYDFIVFGFLDSV